MQHFQPGETYNVNRLFAVSVEGKQDYLGSQSEQWLTERKIQHGFEKEPRISHFIVVPVKITHRQWPEQAIREPQAEIIYKRGE